MGAIDPIPTFVNPYQISLNTLDVDTISLNFKFKGDRNYIHGTDMYNHMLEEAGKSINFSRFKRIKLSIHSIASNQCQLISGKPGELLSKPEHLIADLVVETPEGPLTLMVVETDQSVNERYPYDEAKVEALCKIVDQKIEINEDSGYTPIEVAVAMNKQLHNHLLPSKDGKWFFTRIDLDQPFRPEQSKHISIAFKHNFNNRLTKSELFSKGQTLGHIFFSLVPK